MFKNYMKTAWRSLLKNKFYSMVNIAGLAIGLAVGIMILLWVQDEFSYNGFHKNAGSIYKINSHIGKGADEQVWGGSPAPLAVYCRQSIPEVMNVVRLKNAWQQFLFTYGNKKFIENNIAYVDSNFFSLFDFTLLKGNAAQPFKDAGSVILTASVAQKYFGDTDPIGKVLITDNEQHVVTGVMKDFPANSTIAYSMLFPMSLFAKQFTASGGNGDWKTIDEDVGNFQYDIYLQLQKSASPDIVAKKITTAYQQHRPGVVHNGFYALQPLTSLHLIGADGNNGALQTVQIFLLVAILILVIACINYVNLSTARSMLRSKEVSMRKIVGAARMQLFLQFITESALLFLFASLLAFLIVYLCLPLYNNISGKQLLFSFSNRNVWIVVGVAISGSLLLASIYPALLLSSFKPLLALKGKFSSGTSNTSFRKVLVVTQFFFSIGLITATIVISRQLQFIKQMNLGYNKEYVFAFQMRQDMHDHFDAVKAELAKHPCILGIATSNNNIVGTNSTTGDTDWEGKEPDRTFLIHPNGIDKDFIPLLKMQLVAGKNFSGSKADSAYVILNETAVKQAGIKDPVGKRFKLWDTDATIIGVVKDFNYASLKEAVEPTVFYSQPPNWRVYVKTTGKDASAAIAAAEKIWKTYTPDFPFEYSFLDDDYDKMYRSEQQTGILFSCFGVIAIFISCLGLFGLATYTTQVRVKEIGIRKVLGATVTNITRLLAKDFIALVIIAFVIAAPVAWYIMHQWLQHYYYRIDLSWWIFLATGLLAFMIALLTISFQAIKAALTNPVKSLRSE